MRASFAFALPVLLVTVGCGGDSSSSTTIGSAGGTLTGADGTRLVVPAGALPTETAISISTSDAAAPSGTVAVGAAFEFGPEGATFSTPVTITLGYSPSKIPDGKTASDIVVYTAAKGSTEYAALETVRAEVGDQVSVSVKHFSVFVPAVKIPSVTPGCSVACLAEVDGACECKATCEGVAYSLKCYSLEGCTCSKAGTQTKTINDAISCSDNAKRLQAYSSGCGFPGSSGS
jgi:hypothetical protein